VTNHDRRRYEMLIRVSNFGLTHAPLFPSDSSAHKALAIVAEERGQLETLAVAERTAARSAGAAAKEAARKALVGYLTRAGQTARVLALTTPQLDARIELREWPDDVLLMTMAREFAAKAAAHAALFAEHGIALEEIEQRIAAFDRAVHERAKRREEQVQMRARIDASFARAMQAVKTLDVTVLNHLGTDPVAVAVWKSDRPVRSKRARAGAGDKPATTPSADTASATAADGKPPVEHAA
jgi:hypothetical protein